MRHRITDTRAILMLVFAAVLTVTTRGMAQEGSNPLVESEAPSFDLWCMQIQQYAAARCLARRIHDTAAYDQYRALVEQLARQRASRDEPDQELKDLLNRGSGDAEQ